MKTLMKGMIGFWVLFLVFFLSLPVWGQEKGRIITPGDYFPEFVFPMPSSGGDVDYLGLPSKFFGLKKGDTFSLKEVKADLLLVEYLNKYCFSCQLQAPVMNQVYSSVQQNPDLRGRVRFLGIAAGNNSREAESFKAEKGIPFPVIPDPKFQAYEAIGDPGATPFTLVIRKTEKNLLVANVKRGLTKDPEVILKAIKDSLSADWDDLLKQAKDNSMQQAKAKQLQLRYNEEELLKFARETMASPKGKLSQISKVVLPEGQTVYVGELQAGNQKSLLFATLASRAPTCDICHATHFFFSFDEKGMIRNFLPLQVTKIGNKPWNAKEIEQMKQRLVGRSILQPVDFDAQVDAVSSATLTSALIVDSINKAKSLYEGLKSKGTMKP